MRRPRPLVCTADRGGWNHGTTVDHYNGTVTLNIFRVHEDLDQVTFEYHPRNGMVWSFKNAQDPWGALDAIHRVTDKIGLSIGSLAPYGERD